MTCRFFFSLFVCFLCVSFVLFSLSQTISKFEILDSTEEAEVILISDGKNGIGDLYTATQHCIDAGVVVTSIALTNSADQRLVTISERTGGRLLHITDNGTVSLAAAFTDIVSGGIATDSESSSTVRSNPLLHTVGKMLSMHCI